MVTRRRSKLMIDAGVSGIRIPLAGKVYPPVIVASETFVSGRSCEFRDL